MTDWLSLAKDIMLPSGFGLVQQVSCGAEKVSNPLGSLNSPAMLAKAGRDYGSDEQGRRRIAAQPAGKIHPLPEPSHVPFIDRIHWFLDMRYAELAGEEAPWGDYETSLARERGY